MTRDMFWLNIPDMTPGAPSASRIVPRKIWSCLQKKFKSILVHTDGQDQNLMGRTIFYWQKLVPGSPGMLATPDFQYLHNSTQNSRYLAVTASSENYNNRHTATLLDRKYIIIQK